MPITYRQTNQNPDDNEFKVGPTVIVTPSAGMLAGDLVLFICVARTTLHLDALYVLETGGQTWNDQGFFGSFAGGRAIEGKVFWCRFNGTWSASPSVTGGSSSTPTSGVLHAFIPSAANLDWGVDLAPYTGDFPTPAGPPYTVAIDNTGKATTHLSTVSLAIWLTSDDTSYSATTGTDWVLTGGEQYRNLSGADQSLSFAHKIMTEAGNILDVSKDQAAALLGVFYVTSFFEFTPPTVNILGNVNVLGKTNFL